MTDNRGSLSSNLSIRLLASVFLTVLYGIFLWDSFWGLGFFIVNAALVGTLLVVRPEVNKKSSLIFLIAGLVLSAFIPLRSFWFGRYVTFFFVYLLDVLALVRANSPEPLSLRSLITIPLLVGFNTFLEILTWPMRIKELLVKGKASPDGINQNNLATGILIAIPLLFLFTILLSSADPIFAKYVGDFFSQFSLDFPTIKKIVEIIFFFGLFSSLLGNNYANYQEFGALLKNSRFQKEIAIASIFVVVLLGLFLVVQGEFLFAGESLLKQLNLTLSEYTRNGYEQLLIVSSISLLLIFVLTGKSENSQNTFIKTVTSLYILEVVLLLISATYRVYLYQHTFGLTELRLLGMLFSIWLTGALGLSIYRFTSKSPDNSFFHSLFINAVLVTLLMNLINIDYTVAAYKKPNLGVETDYPYIARLSTDAWPVWEEVLTNFESSTDCTYQKLYAVQVMKHKTLSLYELSKSSWHNFGAWTLPDSQAAGFLNKNLSRIDQLEQRYNSCLSVPRNPDNLPVVPIQVNPGG